MAAPAVVQPRVAVELAEARVRLAVAVAAQVEAQASMRGRPMAVRR